MSELIQTRGDHRLFRKELLATVSTLALIAHVSGASVANAQDADHPTVWIELGGQMETMQGTSTPFTAPFMSLPAGPYDPASLVDFQRPPRFAVGFEGKAVFQPQGSDWIFSAGIRYGRSHTKRHDHQQSPAVTNSRFNNVDKYDAAFDEIKTRHDESHAVLDFTVGRDVGLGRFGQSGISTINAGVRYAQFSQKSTINITARPYVGIQFPSGSRGFPSFHQYTLAGHAERSFRGVGPSVTWNASTALLGNKEGGELTLDWGVNGAILFGRQKAKTDHATQAYFRPGTYYYYINYDKIYQIANHKTRSRSVVVPNLGGFAGVSVQKANAKLSLGYRADFFFGAVDTGINSRQTKTLGFYGPFATVSIGL